MSRRRRKKAKHPSAAWLAIGAGLLIFLAVIAGAIGYWMVQRYLRSDDFRKLLSSKASHTIGIQGEFQPFLWDGFSVRCPGFQAASDGPLRQLNLTSLQTEIGLGGIRRGVWLVAGTRLQRLDLELNADLAGALLPPGETTPTPKPGPGGKSNSPPAWLPDRVELDGVGIDSLSARIHTSDGTASADGIRVTATPGKTASNDWDAVLSGGTIHPPTGFLPEIRLQSAKLRYSGGSVYLSRLDAGAWENAHLEMSGEIQPKSREVSLEGSVQGVKCAEWFDETWAKRFTGDASSDFLFRSSAGLPEASGSLEIRNGVLTALPMLDTLAAYADTRRFRTIVLSDAKSRWRWKPGEFHLSNLQLGCEGLVRVEGSVSVIGRNLSGNLRLGLVPGTLAHLPGAETHVFQPGERNLLWAPVTLNGTLDDPREDLTERLMVAAGARMLETLPETGQKVLKFTGKIIEEAAPATLEKGRDFLQSGDQLIQQGAAAGGIVTDILENVLSPTTEPPPPAQKPEQEPRRPNP